MASRMFVTQLAASGLLWGQFAYAQIPASNPDQNVEVRAARACAGWGSVQDKSQGSVTIDNLTIKSTGNGTVTVFRDGVDLGHFSNGTFDQFQNCLLSVIKLLMPQAECTPATNIVVLRKPDMVTRGGDGRLFANLQNISVSILRLCTPPSNITYKYVISYHFYSGTGVQKADQSITITFLGDNGGPLGTDTFGLDFSRCIYNGGEDRSHEKEIGAIGALVKDITISVPPGGGKVGKC